MSSPSCAACATRCATASGLRSCRRSRSSAGSGSEKERAVVRALLMAGGSGTRLWPLSTEEHPKQFLKLLSEKSLLRETYDRVAPAADGVFVATASRYVPLVRAELPEVPEERILPEPSRR